MNSPDDDPLTLTRPHIEPKAAGPVDLLADWRQNIRISVLRRRRDAAVQGGEPDAPLETFAGDEFELRQEVERELEDYINYLERQREDMEEAFLEMADPEDDGDVDDFGMPF